MYHVMSCVCWLAAQVDILRKALYAVNRDDLADELLPLDHSRHGRQQQLQEA